MRIILNDFDEADIGKAHNMLVDMLGNKYKSCIYTFKDDSAFFAKVTKSGLNISKEKKE